MDLGSGSTYESNMASVSSGGLSNPSGFGNDGGGSDNNDPYQGFVQASQPRGLTAIQRAVENTVQKTKDFFSNPVNKRGIIGSLIGGALLGPFGAFLGGSLGQRYGGNVSSFFNPTVNTDDTEIEMLTRAGMLPNQFTMPMNKPRNIPFLTDGGITNIDIPNFDSDMDLYAKVVGPALIQMRNLEKAKEMESFGGKPLTEEQQKALDKLKEMDADPNRIYSLPVVV